MVTMNLGVCEKSVLQGSKEKTFLNRCVRQLLVSLSRYQHESFLIGTGINAQQQIIDQSGKIIKRQKISLSFFPLSISVQFPEPPVIQQQQERKSLPSGAFQGRAAYLRADIKTHEAGAI